MNYENQILWKKESCENKLCKYVEQKPNMNESCGKKIT